MTDLATRRGRETRERILLSAVRLFHEQGINAVSVDRILVAAEAGKGQFYRCFESKEDLVRQVIDHHRGTYIAWQRPLLDAIGSWEALRAYLDALVDAHERRGLLGGCPIGSLAAEVTDQSERLRADIAEVLGEWRSSLEAALKRMEATGVLREDAPTRALAASTLASIQGGYLLSSTVRDSQPMRDALDGALAHLRSFAGPLPSR